MSRTAISLASGRPVVRACALVVLGLVAILPPLGAAGAPPAQVQPLPPPPNRIFQARLGEFDLVHYTQAVEALVSNYERSGGRPLVPGARHKVGLKVYSDSGAGLATPPALVRAVLVALEKRGFARRDVFLMGLNASRLRDCGFLPPLSVGGDQFEGASVLPLESGRYYDPAWFYDSPLPSHVDTTRSSEADDEKQVAVTETDRKSFLPAPLLFDVDFWINLPMCSDHPVVGVNGALVNITLWNASNTQRFFRSPATAPAAVAEMAAIPELRAGFVFTIITLERYQFIGGPIFNSLYTLSEPLLWLSENPVVIDALMRDRINAGRRAAGFRELPDDLRLVSYAEQLGLGSANGSQAQWIKVPAASEGTR